MLNKRGLEWKPVLWAGGVILFLIVAFYLGSRGTFSNINVDVNLESKPVGEVLGSNWNWLTYFFGPVPSWLSFLGVSDISAFIITIAMFILLWVTFGDIIESFSTFSSPVAWVSSLMIAIIAANLKFVVATLSLFVGIFSFLGGLAVIAGLFGAFIAFVVVNLGIKGWGPWLMRRKAYMMAEKSSIKAAAGGKKLRGTIKALGEVGQELERI